MSLPEGVLLSQRSPLLATLERLARDARGVFVAGLPGMGKSLLIHQLAHLGHARGRDIALLQWDVARPDFEASAAGRRYPQAGGITHPLIRVATGRWARAAVAHWNAAQPARALLIGETPLVGHRFVELVRRADDAAERVLRGAATRFAIPVPSVKVRRHLEAERARRMATPVHPREREDAPPDVLTDSWRELVGIARALGLDAPADGGYDPATYRTVYERLLRHRRAESLAWDEMLPAARVSAYEFRIPTTELRPTSEDADRFITETASAYPDPVQLEDAIASWFNV